MRAVRWHARGDVRVEEVPAPAPPGPGEVQIAPMDLVRGEKSLIGSLSHVGDEDFAVALRLLGRGAVRAAPLITDRIPLGAALSGGLALLRDEPGRHLKILVRPGEVR